MRKSHVAFAALLCAGIAWAADPATPTPPAPVTGKVLEIRDVESFTYLRLGTVDGEIWAAVARTPVKPGAQVTIDNPMFMRDFESKSLNRRFDRIVFGSLAGSGANSGAAGSEIATMHAGLASSLDVGNVKVAKATGPDAHTVAEIVAKNADLRGRTVAVRGKVVKFTPAVLGRNWIHLRDGSGSASDGSNDIVVTTKDEAKIGDVVLVKGVVQTDRDLGSGYSYKVLIEDATLGR